MEVETAVQTSEPKRRSRTKTALIEATKRLLSKSAVSGFTIDDVVREADVARGSFYNHFTGLDSLVTHTLTTVQDDLYVRILSAMEDSPDAAVRLARGTVTVMRYGYANRASARVLMYLGPGVADPAGPQNRILTPILKMGVDDGTFKIPSIDTGVVSVLGICEVGLSRMLDMHHEYTFVRDLTHGLCFMLLRALGVDARRAERVTKDAMIAAFDVPMEA